jgi:hypothetical protein
VVADFFIKNFLISILSDLSVLVTALQIHHFQVFCLPRPALRVVVLLPTQTDCKKNMQKRKIQEKNGKKA